MEVAAEVYCPACAYDLRGVESAACPECGRAVDRAALALATLAWPQRKRLGWFRAYWRTVAHAALWPGSLAAEMAGPVELRDARWFWWVTVWHAWMLVMIEAVVAAKELDAKTNVGKWLAGQVPGALLPLEWAVWPGMIAAVCVLLWLAAASGVASYFCHPRGLEVERQNRAIAVSYYACAPLAVIGPVSLVCGALVWLGSKFNWEGLAVGAAWAGMIGPLVLLVMWYLGTLRVVRRVGDRQWPFMAGLAVGLPVIWAALFVLLVVILPAMIVYAVLFVISST